MRNKVNITLQNIAVLLAVLLTFGCSDNNGEQESYVLNKPCLQWGVSQETVKQKMIDFVLLYEDDNTLIYKGKDTESLISYAFETDKLSTANDFVKNAVVCTQRPATPASGPMPRQTSINSTQIGVGTARRKVKKA